MKKYLKSLLIIFVLAFATVSAVMGTRVVSEERITKEPTHQYSPAIYGDIVVWHDYRNTNSDIYGYNLKTKQEFQITTNTAGQYVPAIYCDRVVWYDDRNNNYDIYIAYLDVVCETAKKSLPMDWFMKHFGLGNKDKE